MFSVTLFSNVLKIVVPPSTIDPCSVSLDSYIVRRFTAWIHNALTCYFFCCLVEGGVKKIRGNTSTSLYFYFLFSFVMFCIGFWTCV